MVKQIYKDFLFSKQILVEDCAHADCVESPENVALILTRLYNDYGIIITGRVDLINRYVYALIEEQIGSKFVPSAFYRSFPASVRSLSEEQLLIDQLCHYFKTYGEGDFSNPGHSIFEKDDVRPLLMEKGEVKYFHMMTEHDSYEIILETCAGSLSDSRPLNPTYYNLVSSVYDDFEENFSTFVSFEQMFINRRINCKNTSLKLLMDKRDARLANHIELPDVTKLVEIIANERKQKINKLSLPNKDRKFITQVLDNLLDNDNISNEKLAECHERKKFWCALLHHIHYIPKSNNAKYFVNTIRGQLNLSSLATFEYYMADYNIKAAVRVALDNKGVGFILRNLNYLLSRCRTDEDVSCVVTALNKGGYNPIILFQLLAEYKTTQDNTTKARSFSFVKNGLIKSHTETPDEVMKRRSKVSKEIKADVCHRLMSMLDYKYNNTIRGKVFVDESFANIALPIYESNGNLGLGCIPKGSRIHIEDNKCVRAFTYWEKVNDIDLSCFAIDEYGHKEEFSWRTMANNRQSKAITFSGDQTSGYNGGSEFFDIDVDEFKKMYPNARYIVFTDNVYTYGVKFKDCLCKAGFMLREELDSGEIYEPKTVKTSYTINCDSKMAYLFAIDILNRDVIWLNLEMASNSSIGAFEDMSFLNKYFNTTQSFNMYDFIQMAAECIVDNAEEARLIFSDTMEGFNVVHSWDIDELMKLINEPFGL